MQCVPVQCEPQDRPLECSQPGFLTMTRPLADNPCCPETLCGEPCALAGQEGGQRAEEGGEYRLAMPAGQSRATASRLDTAGPLAGGGGS